MSSRVERDYLGEIKVPGDKYWGAVTQRSLEHFTIGGEKMPPQMIKAIALVKKAAAAANRDCSVLSEEKCEVIWRVCDEIISGKLEDNFPLCLWQTGSGTQTNMNLNEVIATRGNELAGKKLLSAGDDVNMSQSTNDVFPSAIHVASTLLIEDQLIPSLEDISLTFRELSEKYKDTLKLARTHLMDATPMTFGQELGGYHQILEDDKKIIEDALKHLKRIPLGGTAVGTGLNAPSGYAGKAAKYLSDITGKRFIPAEDFFAAMSVKSALANTHGAMRVLAGDMAKIAEDIRRYSSGPKAGLGEINIPAGEPGSSIMPGKINPTQCEALLMVSAMVSGNDTAMGIAACRGDFQLNVYMPLIAHLMIRSARILCDAMDSFRKNCIAGMTPNTDRMERNAKEALTLATALNTHIGYEKAGQTVAKALAENISLREAAINSGYVTPEEFDTWCDPRKMIKQD